MPNEPSKISGNANAAIGAVKENIGSALGNESLQSKGAEQRAEGNIEYKAAEAKGYAEGTKESMKGSAKDTVGSAMGNGQMQAEGKASKISGDTQKEMNS